MRSTTRVGAAALGAVLTSSALLGTAGTAFAQTPAPCDPGTYPPVQCEVVGGNSSGTPPLVVNRTVGAPGSSITVSPGPGCPDGAAVTLSLLRISNGTSPVSLSQGTGGGNDIEAVIPADAQPGVYVLYTSCTVNGVSTVATTSFVVIAGRATSSSAVRSSSAGTTTTAPVSSPAEDETALVEAVAAEALPATWTAPAAWDAAPADRAAVSRAVNLRLAALKTALPATQEVAAPRAAAPADTTLWYAGAAGAAFLMIGAAGYRRRAAAQTATAQTATTDEASQ